MEDIKNQMFSQVLREGNIWLQLATHLMYRWSIQQEMLFKRFFNCLTSFKTDFQKVFFQITSLGRYRTLVKD
jgi:hypothetical protein